MIFHGDAVLARARKSETEGASARARNEYVEASFWYFFARFPHIINPEGADAYQRHIAAYKCAARHFDGSFEELAIPFEPAPLTAYLRIPAQAKARRVPAVVIWGGIDVWKSDLELHSQSEAILQRGIATLSIDSPGTGQCPIPASPDAERVYLAAIDAVRTHHAINPDLIGCFGLSFGGHWAVKVALLRPGLAGVVNNGGPIHHSFDSSRLGALPPGTRIALARMVGLNPAGDPEALASRLGELSLVRQGLLPATRHSPLLSLNGEFDELVTIKDLDLMSQVGVRQDRLIFGNDRHCASRNSPLHRQFVADWFAYRMREGLSA